MGTCRFAQSGFDRTVVDALDRWAREMHGRVLLIRRPGRHDSTAERRWFRVDSRPGRETIRTGSVSVGGELVAALSDPGTEFDGPLHLVCTHGRHDTCYAVHGRPLAATLTCAAAAPGWMRMFDVGDVVVR